MSCSTCLCNFLFYFSIIHFLMHAGGFSEQLQIWSYEVEQAYPWQCSYAPRADNTTGLKVIIAGMSKTGTSTTARAVHTLGFKSWHGIDWKKHIMIRGTDEFWRLPENGGHGDPTEIQTVRAPAYTGSTLWALRHPSNLPENLYTAKDIGRRVSRCRVDSTTFDGHELYTMPVIKASPDAKVIMLNWRTFEERQRSGMKFNRMENGLTFLYGYFINPSHLVPYMRALIPIAELISGGGSERIFRQGMSLTEGMWEVPPLQRFSHNLAVKSFNNRWVFKNRFMTGAGVDFPTSQAYDQYWSDVREAVPSERLFEWDMRRHTFEDLCGFLGVKSPVCRPERLPKVEVEVMRTEADYPFQTAGFLLLELLLWLTNVRASARALDVLGRWAA